MRFTIACTLLLTITSSLAAAGILQPRQKNGNALNGSRPKGDLSRLAPVVLEPRQQRGESYIGYEDGEAMPQAVPVSSEKVVNLHPRSFLLESRQRPKSAQTGKKATEGQIKLHLSPTPPSALGRRQRPRWALNGKPKRNLLLPKIASPKVE
ncbi:hypothetical protein BJ508DRAFT_409899 [Ascobolus immersus RN42]|uniref:Uncharacterized protein n=1 Tax=Ascobolus immersus RN42 TaxID=1160509 RepID=A0A3N4IUN8_ASCIM|nr:hypothetical protein BJ508DRAFT_409899 [Ascobolus immersus RN42]